MAGRRTILIGLVLFLAAACSTAGPFPDPVRPAVLPQDLAGVADLLESAVPEAGAPVRGVDIGPPDLPRSVVAAWVVSSVAGPADPRPAEELVGRLLSGRFLPVPGSADLVALRAAVETAPRARRHPGFDPALARALRAWRPAGDADAATGALDTVRFLTALRGTPLPESWAVARRVAAGRHGCGAGTAPRDWPAISVRLAGMAGTGCAAGREPAPVADDAPLTAQLGRWRALADQQLVAGAGGGAPAVDRAEVAAAARRLESAWDGPAAYAGGAPVPLTVAASALAAARDLGTGLAPGPGNVRLARAVAASGGGMADRPGPGSVLDGVLGRVTLRWTTGRLAGSLPRPSTDEPGGLDVAARVMFGDVPSGPPAVGARTAPSAVEAVEALGSVAAGSCDEPALARFRDVIGHLLGAPPGEGGGLDDVASGVPVWALLGLQAERACGVPGVTALAVRLQRSVAPPPAGGAEADRLASRWVGAELSCLTGSPVPVGATRTPVTAPDVSRTASTSAVYGVGAVAYMQLRLDRIEQAGCGGDVATVLRSW